MFDTDFTELLNAENYDRLDMLRIRDAKAGFRPMEKTEAQTKLSINTFADMLEGFNTREQPTIALADAARAFLRGIGGIDH